MLSKIRRRFGISQCQLLDRYISDKVYFWGGIEDEPQKHWWVLSSSIGIILRKLNLTCLVRLYKRPLRLEAPKNSLPWWPATTSQLAKLIHSFTLSFDFVQLLFRYSTLVPLDFFSKRSKISEYPACFFCLSDIIDILSLRISFRCIFLDLLDFSERLARRWATRMAIRIPERYIHWDVLIARKFLSTLMNYTLGPVHTSYTQSRPIHTQPSL